MLIESPGLVAAAPMVDKNVMFEGFFCPQLRVSNCTQPVLLLLVVVYCSA
jgi:hypothetical protein